MVGHSPSAPEARISQPVRHSRLVVSGGQAGRFDVERCLSMQPGERALLSAESVCRVAKQRRPASPDAASWRSPSSWRLLPGFERTHELYGRGADGGWDGPAPISCCTCSGFLWPRGVDACRRRTRGLRGPDGGCAPGSHLEANSVPPTAPASRSTAVRRQTRRL
jgi:hypothetical protein